MPNCPGPEAVPPATTIRPSGWTATARASSWEKPEKFVRTVPPFPNVGSSMPSANAGVGAGREQDRDRRLMFHWANIVVLQRGWNARHDPAVAVHSSFTGDPQLGASRPQETHRSLHSSSTTDVRNSGGFPQAFRRVPTALPRRAHSFPTGSAQRSLDPRGPRASLVTWPSTRVTGRRAGTFARRRSVCPSPGSSRGPGRCSGSSSRLRPVRTMAALLRLPRSENERAARRRAVEDDGPHLP